MKHISMKLRHFTALVLLCYTSLLTAQPGFEYGLLRDPNDSLLVNVVAVPNFSSQDVRIITSVFTFLVPEGTSLTPTIPPAPGVGTFLFRKGSWDVQMLNGFHFLLLGLDRSLL